ncbi:MAG: amidase [Haloplanus sp.]
MPDAFDDETIREAANRFRTPRLGADDADAARTLLHDAARRYGADDDAPTRTLEVRPGDDAVGAFRHRFELGGRGGALDLTVGVKDNFGVAGAPMACGSAPLADALSTRDAVVIERLLDAGATLVGKTHMDEFAYGATGETNAFGPVRNPADPTRVAGGSSAGSAAAVAAGLCAAALGSDTGGSVRIPAAFCGVVGFKPTWGRVPSAGMIPLAPSFDHPGVLARDVATAGRVHAAMGDPDADESAVSTPEPASLDGIRLGVLAEGFGDHVTEGAACVRDGVAAFESAGVETVEVSIPAFRDGAAIWDVVTNAELAVGLAAGGLSMGHRETHDPSWHAALAAALREGTGFGETLRTKAAAGAALVSERPAWYAAAQNDRAAFARDLRAPLADVDALCLPTMPRTAPEIGRGAYASRVPLAVNTRPANLAGVPAISLPAGSVDGRPVGLQLLGTHGDDRELLSLAAAVEPHCE